MQQPPDPLPPAARAAASRTSPLRAAFGCLCGAAVITLAVVAVVLLARGAGAPRPRGARIAVINVSGVIASADGGDLLFGEVSVGAPRIVQEIRDAVEDDNVRAVVVRINSPGGTAAAAQEIFEALLHARETKPFVASMADVAASGGYYVAAGCDRIVAQRATMTGSIGVIMRGLDASELMKWVRVKDQTIKSGANKDIGSPFRALTPDQRRLMQTMVDDVYEQFLDDVAIGRKDSVERIRPYADGRIMTGSQAAKLRLVDELGGFWQAVVVAKELGGLPRDADPGIPKPARRSLLEQLLAVRAPAAPTVTLPLGARPRVPMPYYLAPGIAIDLQAGN